MLAYFYVKILLFTKLTILTYNLYVITFLITYFQNDVLKKKKSSNNSILISF